jgi:hypothetical protein
LSHHTNNVAFNKKIIENGFSHKHLGENWGVQAHNGAEND